MMVYPVEVPYAEDILSGAKDAYVGMGRFIDAVLGASTQLNGFNCTASTPAALTVDVNSGEIYSLQVTDPTAYGALPPDAHPLMKQGIMLDKITLNTPAPISVGDSVNYLVQVAFSEVDNVADLRNFYQTVAQTVNTERQDLAIVNVKAGIPAPTGTQVTPTPDAGFTGAWVVTVANGQTTVTSGNISVYAGSPLLIEKLADKISQTTADGRYVIKPSLQLPAYAFRAFGTSGIVYGGGTSTIQLDQIDYDTAGWFNTSTYRFTPTIPCIGNFTAGLAITGTPNHTMVMALNSVSVSFEYVLNSSAVGNISTCIKFNGTTDFIDLTATFDETVTAGTPFLCGSLIAN